MKGVHFVAGASAVLVVSGAVFLGLRPVPVPSAPAVESAQAAERDGLPVPPAVLDNIVGPALKDPTSAVWGPAVYVHHDGVPVICGTVNARNSFGARAGEVRFISLGNVQTTAFDGVSSHFRREWKQWCSTAGL